MPTRDAVEAAVSALLRKTFRDEQGATPIEAEFDATILEHDSKVVLDVGVYVTCDEDDQETAAILVREEWWSIVSSALYERLGVEVEARPLQIHW